MDDKKDLEELFVQIISKLRQMKLNEIEQCSMRTNVSMSTLNSWAIGIVKYPKKENILKVAQALGIKSRSHLRVIK